MWDLFPPGFVCLQSSVVVSHVLAVLTYSICKCRITHTSCCRIKFDKDKSLFKVT